MVQCMGRFVLYHPVPVTSNSIGQNKSEANSIFSDCQEIPYLSCNMKLSLPRLRELAILSYPTPDEASPYLHIIFI
jgi:hypothetical protein